MVGACWGGVRVNEVIRFCCMSRRPKDLSRIFFVGVGWTIVGFGCRGVVGLEEGGVKITSVCVGGVGGGNIFLPPQRGLGIRLL